MHLCYCDISMTCTYQRRIGASFSIARALLLCVFKNNNNKLETIEERRKGENKYSMREIGMNKLTLQPAVFLLLIA